MYPSMNKNSAETSQSSDWSHIVFPILMGLLAMCLGFLIITDRYWPPGNSVQNGKALIWVNWLNALLGRSRQTRLTKRQKHVFGYISIVAGLFTMYVALRPALIS